MANNYPSDQTAIALASQSGVGTDGPNYDTASASPLTGTQANVSITINYTIDETGGAAGRIGTGEIDYSTNSGSSWTNLVSTTNDASGIVSTGNLGSIDVANIRVRAMAQADILTSGDVSVQTDINSWYVTYDRGGRVVLLD